MEITGSGRGMGAVSPPERFEALPHWNNSKEATMKRWYESKTIWLGLATITTAVISAVAGGAGWQEAVIAAIGAANIFVRTQTDKPIGK